MKTTVEVMGFLGILLVSAITTCYLAGCAIEMIAVVRTDEAVNGKLSISKESSYVAQPDSSETSATSSTSFGDTVRRVLPGFSD